MKRLIFYPLFFIAVFAFSSFGYCENPKSITPEQMVKNIQWLGQAAVRINTEGLLIYIDPYKIKKPDKADIILITHSHKDHFSEPDIQKLTTQDTLFVAPNDCVESLGKITKNKVHVLEPGMKAEIKGLLIEATAAYNIVKTNYHPKSKKWVGYILTINGVRIYHGGDTEKIPEMKDINCDIAMLPLGQTYTMNSVKEAAEAALDTHAKIAIPIHYGLYEGTVEDAQEFKRLLKDKIKVFCLDKAN